MSFVRTQTFDFHDNRDELQVLGAALEALRMKDYSLAAAVLIARQDKLTERPRLKDYNPREAHV